MFSLIRVLVVKPLAAVLGPFFLAILLGAPWPWIYLAVGAWLAWVAYIAGSNAYFVWRAIFQRRPWRDAYYRSLFHQGASRAKAYEGSAFAPLTEPVRFVLAAFFAFGVGQWYFVPSARPDVFSEKATAPSEGAHQPTRQPAPQPATKKAKASRPAKLGAKAAPSSE